MHFVRHPAAVRIRGGLPAAGAIVHAVGSPRPREVPARAAFPWYSGAHGGHAGAATRKTAGQGLIDLRERATIHHGTATAVPAPEGGFEIGPRVRAPRPGGGHAHAVRARRR
ncbi:hypothetical protein [Streptomyces sp. NBC_00207]|uniref:hypothetical protein n=1 Tax=unclassified Streptomyces TaxID=2593676 RepID=UPI002886EA14|nr:hypothetical protein [Streptomyces sp. DSM 41633]